MSISKPASNLTVTLGISMRSGYTIWGKLLFFIWFFGLARKLAGPLTESEIATFTARAQSKGLSAEQLARFEMFMRDDDGGEFSWLILSGLLRARSHPETGAKVDARELVQSYFRPFASKFLPVVDTQHFLPARCRAILRRGVSANPGWDIANLMRYRSRRDLLMLATEEDFNTFIYISVRR